MTWRDHLKIHPAAELFPLLKDIDPKALRALANDIKENGLQQPIVIYADRLLDGRNRLDAMEKVGAPYVFRCVEDIFGVEPRVIEADDDFDPYAYVISANIHRRHLTAADKDRLIAAVLKAKPDASDRAVADTVKVSPTTVGKARRKLEQAGELSTVDSRTGRDGKARRQPASSSGGRDRQGSPMSEPAPTSPIEANPSISHAKPISAPEALPVEPTSPPEANPIVTAWNGATREQQEEFLRHLAGQGWSVPVIAEFRVDEPSAAERFPLPPGVTPSATSPELAVRRNKPQQLDIESREAGRTSFAADIGRATREQRQGFVAAVTERLAGQ